MMSRKAQSQRPLTRRLGRAAVVGLVFLWGGGVGGAQELEALLARGDAHYEKFDNRKALAAYEAARELAPDAFPVLRSLTRTYHDYGLDLDAAKQKSEAEASLRKALALAQELKEKHPDQADSYFFLAAANGSLARFTGGKKKVEIGHRVEEHALKAIELDPDLAIAYAVLGVFYREVAELNWVQRAVAKVLYGGAPKATKEDAVASLTQALEVDPGLTFAHYELALTYESMGRRQDALPHLDQCVQLGADTSQDLRNQEKAKKLLKKWR